MTLEKILEAREERWNRKCALIRQHEGACVVSLTLRMPSELRRTEDAEKVFLMAKEHLACALENAFSRVSVQYIRDSFDGPYALMTVYAEAESVKRACIRLEENAPFGDLVDADVMKSFGEEISRKDVGGEERRCLVCPEKNARICLINKKHTREETARAVQEKIRQLILERV